MGKYNILIKVLCTYLNVQVFFHRFFAAEIRDAAKEMSQNYDKDLIGKVALSVYRHHNSSGVMYEFGEDAQEYFDKILDNLASQFNSHYNLEEDFSDSQPILSLQQREDIDACTKVGELIGRLSCVLWIYRNGR